MQIRITVALEEPRPYSEPTQVASRSIVLSPELAVSGVVRPVIAEAVSRKRQPLRGQDKIGLKVGAVLDRHKMAKHFDIAITPARLSFSRKADAIAAEAALDGIYVVRTTVAKATLDDLLSRPKPKPEWPS